mmetsp:Transcript_20365/g.42123  ORF Transcript_20365/g.42123 Transcript_20365/m.42123 type:complete len:194 (-) Transcript_20365:503-1084(-)
MLVPAKRSAVMTSPCPVVNSWEERLGTTGTSSTSTRCSIQSVANWLHSGNAKVAELQAKESQKQEKEPPSLGGRAKSKLRKLRQRERLQEFLKSNGFADEFEPRLGSSCFFRAETIYPLHLAAKVGDCEVVRLLLAAGAPPTQRTSRGRTALDFATKSKAPAQQRGKVLELLSSQGPVFCLKEALDVMSAQIH